MVIKMKLDELFREKDEKKKKAAKYVNVDVTTMSNWIHGRSFPRLDQAVLLADFFKVNLTDLFEKIEEENESL